MNRKERAQRAEFMRIADQRLFECMDRQREDRYARHEARKGQGSLKPKRRF